jgi:hypothetical protein
MILVIAVGLHVTDQALIGFLSVYNPTVFELISAFHGYDR